MCCKWLSCQWRSHASIARVNTVRWDLFDESASPKSSKNYIFLNVHMAPNLPHSSPPFHSLLLTSFSHIFHNFEWNQSYPTSTFLQEVSSNDLTLTISSQYLGIMKLGIVFFIQSIHQAQLRLSRKQYSSFIIMIQLAYKWLVCTIASNHTHKQCIFNIQF